MKIGKWSIRLSRTRASNTGPGLNLVIQRLHANGHVKSLRVIEFFSGWRWGRAPRRKNDGWIGKYLFCDTPVAYEATLYIRLVGWFLFTCSVYKNRRRYGKAVA